MNLKPCMAKNSTSRSTRNKVALCLHQCKKCGLLFEHIGKAAAASCVAEFSWDRKFMVDKCDTCRSFGLYNVFI